LWGGEENSRIAFTPHKKVLRIKGINNLGLVDKFSMNLRF
jgi:hypothetical protein